jgi:hypothetical protein
MQATMLWQTCQVHQRMATLTMHVKGGDARVAGKDIGSAVALMHLQGARSKLRSTL